MNKTTDVGTLKTSFAKSLLGFYSARQWLDIANDVPLSAVKRECNSTNWSLDRTIKLFESQIEVFDERSKTVDEELKSLDIKDAKFSWIDCEEMRKFKVDSEKYGFAILHLKELLADCKRIKDEFAEIARKYEIGLKMANGYLYRLCELERKISETEN